MKAVPGYSLAKAVWQFYDSDFLVGGLTKYDVHFVYERRRDSRAIFMDEPLLLAQFGSASSTAPPTSQDGIHDMPKLLALGILLLEIETRTFIEGHRENPGLNPTETVDMDTDYRIARRIVDVNDPQNILSEMQTTSPLTTVLPLCVVAGKLQNRITEQARRNKETLSSDKLSQLNKVRKTIYAEIVEPLREFRELFPEIENIKGIRKLPASRSIGLSPSGYGRTPVIENVAAPQPDPAPPTEVRSGFLNMSVYQKLWPPLTTNGIHNKQVESAVRRAKAKAILIFSAASNQRNMDEIYCPANLDDCVFGIFAANAGNRESRDLNPSMAVGSRRHCCAIFGESKRLGSDHDRAMSGCLTLQLHPGEITMLKSYIIWLLAVSTAVQLTPADPVSLRRLPPTEAKRADTNLVGYLGAFFLGADPYVYFYQSNGNNPVSFRALNRAEPVIRPTKGTGGVRDPAIVQGSGEEEGKKWYIVGTDLNIGKTNWDAAQRTGSRGIFVWESIDLVNWGNERLVVVEDSTAGMVWAPEALWDASQEQYLVHWASKFYSASDTRHTGTPSNIRIRYAYTRDFRAFTAPQTYIDRNPTSIIDLDILPLYPDADNQQYVRFMKDETRKTVFMEYSTTGLFGNWTRAGGGGGTIASQVEGPAAYRDNLVDGKVHVLLDFYGGDGYRPYESTGDLRDNRWTASSRNGFPSNLRHGSVLPVNQTLFDALSKKWGS
ncbi:arabinosidase [Apiospora saccharicola]|uniref:Arabinosidase n=1 Tax=Apiospora saccharicola TaxID=335842 RepID=A0ABR1U344_9PEZI